MRILQVVAYLGPGGAERVALQLAEDAIAGGGTAAIAATPHLWVDRARAAGVSLVPLRPPSRSPAAFAASAMRLARAMRGFRPDIVHTHNVRMTATTRAALIAIRPAPALITTFHGVSHERYRQAASILRRATPHVVACSAAVGHALADAGYPAARIEVIMNGARLAPAADADVREFRQRHGIGDRPLVAGLGRLVPQKAWHVLIAAAERVPEADFLVAGDGPLQASLEQEARARGVSVRFLGSIDDVAALLTAADCFVSTSTWEGLPLSLLEAMSLGVPAVVTAVDGVADVASDETAIMIPPGDPPAVARGIRTILDDPGLAERMAAAARATSARWDPRAMVEQYRQTYERLLRDTPAGGR